MHGHMVSERNMPPSRAEYLRTDAPAFGERLFNSMSVRATRDPERIAIAHFDRGGTLRHHTYQDLFSDIEGAVLRLQAGGVRSGMRIGLLAKNCYEWVVTDFALIRIGCTSVVFAEEFSSRTTEDLLSQYGLSLLLLSKHDVWPGVTAGAGTAYIDDATPVAGVRETASQDDPPIHSIIFSSGTEGAMKCMSVDHEGLDQALGYFRTSFQFGESDSLLIFLPLSSNQQRAMVYEGVKSGYLIQLVPFAELMRGLETLHPTMLVAPPLFFEMVHAQYENALAKLPSVAETAVRWAMKLVKSLPEPISLTLRKRIFGLLHQKFGGHMRLMLTGMAPIKSTTLLFYELAGMPLYQVYGLTEIGPIAMNRPGDNVIGSVGKPVAEGTVTLADDGEILVHRNRFIVREYLGVPEEVSRQTFVAENTIATGDLGRFDAHGNLYVIGRKKQTIVLGSGYKVSPELLEGQLNVLAGVERSVVFGTNRPFITAIISMRTGQERCRQEMAEMIANINRGLPERSRVTGFYMTDKQFRIDNGLLTRTLKLNRAAIEEMFKDELEHLYTQETSVFQGA